MSGYTLGKCTHNNSCYNCDNNKCGLRGRLESDCPKYRCDRTKELQYQCDTCAFVKRFIKDIYGEVIK